MVKGEWEELERRTISGTGELRVPVSDTVYRELRLEIQVIRERNVFDSFKFSPAKSFFANVTFSRKGYVVDERAVCFRQVSWSYIPDYSSNIQQSIFCGVKEILRALERISSVLAIEVSPNIDILEDFESLDDPFDQVRICCYGRTALSVVLSGLTLDGCVDPPQSKKPRKPKPPPDDQQQPPGGNDPVTVDDNYPPDEDIPDDTDPAEGDEFEPEPPPACTALTVLVQLKLQGINAFNQPYRVFAEYGGVRVNPTSAFSLQIFCQGTVGGTCVFPADWKNVDSTSRAIESFSVLSVTVD